MAADSYVLKHYKDGKLHKDYDRALTMKSLVTFPKDPSGNLPWDKDPTTMDLNKPENSGMTRKYNMTGFPTLLYFSEGVFQFVYPGDNVKAAIKAFLADTKPEVEEKPKKREWADEPSQVVHLTDENFDR